MASRFGTPGSVRVTVSTGPEWKRVADALRLVDERFDGQFRNAVREVSEKLAARARANVLKIPTHTAQHTGLRARVAHGVGTKITAHGVDITTSMDDRSEVNLPAYLDQQDGWRHPVFGNRHVWVRQTTGGSWFRETIESGRDDIENALHDVMEDGANTISRAGMGR